MTINFSRVLIGLNGQPIPCDESGRPTTLRDVAMVALATDVRDERSTGAEKFQRWQLAQRITQGQDIVSVSDAKLIKERIGLVYNTAIVGPAWAAVEGDAPAGEQGEAQC